MKINYGFLLLLCPVFLSHAQEFEKMYPSTPVSHVQALVRWNGDTVYASGANSVFLRSTDAGRTWSQVFSTDTQYDFPRMGANKSGIYLLPAYTYATLSEFADTTSTFLLHYNPEMGDTHRVTAPILIKKPEPTWLPRDLSVTDHAVFMLQYYSSDNIDDMALIRSTDEGVTWDNLSLPAPIMHSYGRVFFRDDSVGIVIAPLKDSLGGHFYAVFTTSTAGAKWERVYGFSYPRQTTSSLVQYLGDSIILLGEDGYLHITHDRGEHWTASSFSPFPISAFHFVQSGTGYISGTDCQIARTTDFGASWIMVKDNPVLGGPGRSIANACLSDDSYIYFDDAGVAVRTTNGGTTWDYAFSEESWDVYALRFFSKNDGFIETRIGLWDYYYGTSDGGATWRPLFNSGDVAWRKVSPANANEIWAVGDFILNNDTLVLHSSNKGASWMGSCIRQPGDTINITSRGVFTCGADSLCVLLNRGILRTTDKGRSWSTHTQIRSLVTDAEWKGLKIMYSCFNRHIWLCTSNGIFRSDDYGISWIRKTELNTTIYNEWYGFKAVSDSIAYVILRGYSPSGATASYMRTLNAGETWDIYHNNDPSQGPDFFNTLLVDGTGYSTHWLYDNNEYITGNQLFKTTDAWQTYTRIFGVHAQTSNGFLTYFLDRDYGWVYLDALYRTTNGGVNWVKEPPLETPRTFSVDQVFPNPTTAPRGTTMEFTVGGNRFMPVYVELYDILGKQLSVKYQGSFAPGRHVVHISTSTLPPGMYALHVSCGSMMETRRLLVKTQ